MRSGLCKPHYIIAQVPAGGSAAAAAVRRKSTKPAKQLAPIDLDRMRVRKDAQLFLSSISLSGSNSTPPPAVSRHVPVLDPRCKRSTRKRQYVFTDRQTDRQRFTHIVTRMRLRASKAKRHVPSSHSRCLFHLVEYVVVVVVCVHVCFIRARRIQKLVRPRVTPLQTQRDNVFRCRRYND